MSEVNITDGDRSAAFALGMCVSVDDVAASIATARAEGYAAGKADADNLKQRNQILRTRADKTALLVEQATECKGIIDCTGEVPVVRVVLHYNDKMIHSRIDYATISVAEHERRATAR